MGTIPTITTFTAGQTLTAANLNAIKSTVDFWALTPRAYAWQSTTVSTTTSTSTLMPFQSEVFDVVQSGDSPMHDTSTNNSRIVVRTPGKYTITGQVTFDNNGTGVRQAFIRLNAAGAAGGGTQVTLANAPALTAVPTSVPLAIVTIPLVAGDYVELFGWQNSGGALGTTIGQGLTFMMVTLDAS